VAKPYAAAVENQQERKWVHCVAQPLTGKTLGILRLGPIGEAVGAQEIQALSCRPLYLVRDPDGGPGDVAQPREARSGRPDERA
jgi:phosphoglycerate dehydrogenase-like enzyme